MLTTFAVAMVYSKPLLSDEIEVGTRTESVNGNAMGHEIRKRSPITPWFPPLYGSCAFGTKLGLKIVKVIYPTLFGPLGKALLPVVPPALGKAFLAGLCPKLGLAG